MVVGTLSLVQKGQTSGCSGCSHTVDTVTQWTRWMQYTVDAVSSGIVVYGGGDIVFGAKRSIQWTLWTQYIVDAVCSGIVVYDGGNIVFDTQKVKPVDAVCSTQWMQWNSGIWWWGHCL